MMGACLCNEEGTCASGNVKVQQDWQHKGRLWHHLRRQQVFRVKKLVGRQWGAPNSNYLLAMGWPGTFVMPFSITLNASHAHIKQTHTCIHRHTQTCTDTPTHIIQTQTYTRTHTHHTDTHTTCVVCVCVYVCAHGNPQTYTWSHHAMGSTA